MARQSIHRLVTILQDEGLDAEVGMLSILSHSDIEYILDCLDADLIVWETAGRKAAQRIRDAHAQLAATRGGYFDQEIG